MRRIFYNIWRKPLQAIACFILLLALVISVGRLLIPQLSSYKNQFENIATQALQKPVQIGNISAELKGFEPVIKFSDITLFKDDHQTPLLHADELMLGVNMIDSLRRRQIAFDNVFISGVRLNLIEDGKGNFSLKDFPQRTTSIGAWLVSKEKIYLHNIEIDIFHLKTQRHTTINHLDGHFTWKQNNNLDWQLKADPVKLTINHHVWPQTYFNIIQRHTADADKQIIVQVGYLQIQDVVTALQEMAMLPSTWQNALQQISPQGELLDLLLSVKLPVKNKVQIMDWVVDSNYKNIFVQPWQPIPGMKNISGHIRVTSNEGEISLDSKSGYLNFPRLFLNALEFNLLSGHIQWHKLEDRWHVTGENIYVENNDLNIFGNGYVDIPFKGDSEAGLLAGFDVIKAEHTSLYLPAKIMKPTVVDWLTKSFQRGFAPQGTFILQGTLKNFPFDKDNVGTFLVSSPVKDVILNYSPEWPVIKQIEGNLTFSNCNMQTVAVSGKILSTPLRAVKVEIPYICKGKPSILMVNGAASGNLSDGLQFLQQSLFKKQFGKRIKTMTTSGYMKVELNFSLPLDTPKSPTKVAGVVDFTAGNLRLPNRKLKMTDLVGNMNFTESGISAENIRGMLFDHLMILNVKTNNNAEKILKTNVDIQSSYFNFFNLNFSPLHLQLARLSEAFDIDLQTPITSGKIILPDDPNQTLQVNLNHLYLNKLSGDKEKISLKTIPAIDLIISDFRYAAKQFGRIELNLVPFDQGIRIAKLQLNGPSYVISGRGDWYEHLGREHSHLEGSVVSENVATTLQSWGLPAAVSSNHAKIEYSLNWPDAPYAFNIDKSSGHFALSMKQGRIVDIGGSSPFMNLGKLLNLLSLETLKRRLKLDFSDLTESGFSFDSMSANFTLSKGNAFTQDGDFTGTAANVKFRGRIGLANEDYDLIMVVGPNVTSSIPVVATLTGGPIAGLVALAADKVLSPGVQKLTEQTYKITGPWKNPAVKHM